MGYDDYFTEQMESGIIISGPYLGWTAVSNNSMPEIN